MLNSEFNDLVEDIVYSGNEDRAWLEAQVKKARRKLAGAQTNDMVLFAHLVAAYIESEYESVPNLEWILQVPGSYLEKLRAGVFPGGFACLDRASDFYRAGVPAEMVVAAKNALFGMTGSGEWTYSEIVELHNAGVTAEYVAQAGPILCGPKAFIGLFRAGVAPEYATALIAKGLKPKHVRENWAVGIPVEYVVF